jgi:RNA polymerase sigma factor for flagellar operon FliA
LYYKEELTMKEISQVVGIAVSRVSQIHAAAMAKLRVSLRYLHEDATSPVNRMKPAFQIANSRGSGR